MATSLREDSDAQGVVGALDTALAVLRQLHTASRSDFEDLKRDAARALAQLDNERELVRSGKGRQRERQRAVDEWILDIFRATESALPREDLLAEFVARYRRERRVADVERHAGPWLFHFRWGVDAEGKAIVEGVAAAGVHPRAFTRLCELHLPMAAADPFMQTVMHEERDIDGWHAAWFEASPLFDALLDTSTRFGGERDYWVSAVALPGDARQPVQGVFVIHPNAGQLLDPEPPSTMRQDQRLLLAFLLAWRQLEHQVKALVALSESDRREMLNLIAPGLMHHELGATLRTLYAQAYEQFHLLKAMAMAMPGRDIEAATRYSHGIATLARRGHHITDVFNNLDKRGQRESVSMHKMMDDLRVLLHHRLGSAGTELLWDRAALAAEVLDTDVVLLQQALFNILNNALNAIVEHQTPPPRRIEVRLRASSAEGIELDLLNNGPPIPGHAARDIFRRGFTTRAQGHGQGLYLVRLIAHYLRGEASLIEAAQVPQPYKVGFRFSCQRRLEAPQGLGRAVIE